MQRLDVLPDDILLEIFDFYANPSYGFKSEIESWQTLVHVCRQWRNLVFRSPRRLNLRLLCTPRTPVRDTLDVWQALPLIIDGVMTLTSSTFNIITALGQSNCVCQVSLLNLVGWQLEEVLAAMQVPFPELTDLRLHLYDKTSPVIPDSFLDGSAPRLQFFEFSGIPFTGLPNLLLSASHLVSLELSDIPHSGYISPEAIVALISVLSSLASLYLGFESPQSRPDLESRSLPQSKRIILPTLDLFRFKGVTEYLEDLVTRIDTPQLDEMDITFFNQIDFDCPRFAQFFNRTLTRRTPDQAYVQFDDSTASVKLRYRPSNVNPHDVLIDISCREPDWQLSSIEQVCNSLDPLSTVQDLYIKHEYTELVWKDDAIENTLWLQLFLPFTAVIKEFARGIAATLQELGESGITEVLPSLQHIFVEALEPSGPFQKDIGQFVAARRLSDHPIAISDCTNTSTSWSYNNLTVMKRVGIYSPYSLAFTFILYHSSCTRKVFRCSTRLLLTSFLLKISPSLPFSPGGDGVLIPLSFVVELRSRSDCRLA